MKKLKKTYVTLFVATMLVFQSAWSMEEELTGPQLYKKGIEYLNKDDVEGGLFYLKKSARKGNTKAFYKLGYLYLKGHKIKINVKMASRCLDLLKTTKNKNLLYRLGLLYLNHNEIEQHIEKAIWCLTKSARLKNTKALDKLKLWYLCNHEIETEAEKIFSCLKGSKNLQKEKVLNKLKKMGTLYFNSALLEKNIKKASLYMKISGKLGNPKALYELGALYIKDKKSYEAGLKCLVISANLRSENLLETLEEISNFYLNAWRLEENYVDSIDYLKTSAALGNSRACSILGGMYLDTQDIEKGLSYLEQSANLGNLNAWYDLALLHLSDKKIMKNVEKAVFYLEKSSFEDIEDSHLLYKLGQLSYEINEIEKAIQFLEKSENLGNEDASYALGVLYLNNDKITRDMNKAMFYLKKVNLKDIEDQTLLYVLGCVYIDDKKDESDLNKGLAYLEKLGLENIEDPNLLYTMGKLYLDRKEFKKGLCFLEKAEKNGNTDALRDLAHLYIRGAGIEKDFKKAHFYESKLQNIKKVLKDF